jgi:hypothetical protein
MGQVTSNSNSGRHETEGNSQVRMEQPFEEQHFPVAHWARHWGFCEKTIREWFRDEFGPGILRQHNTGRRKKRDYTTIMVSARAAARVYAKRTERVQIH